MVILFSVVLWKCYSLKLILFLRNSDYSTSEIRYVVKRAPLLSAFRVNCGIGFPAVEETSEAPPSDVSSVLCG